MATRTAVGLGLGATVLTSVAVSGNGGPQAPVVGTVVGFGKGVVNGLNRLVPLDGNERGDVFEPRGRDQLRGYHGAIDTLRGLHLLRTESHTWRDAAAGAPVAKLRLEVPDDGAVHAAHVTFRATADEGADWSTRDRAASVVGVYVDGAYQSDVAVPTERTDPFDVDLGQLAPGRHTVVLRDASNVTPGGAGAAEVSGAAVSLTSGEQALVDAHQPIFETRAIERTGVGPELAWNDTPLQLSPRVTHGADGSTKLEYMALFSAEDGGTPWPKLLATTGRTSDFEPIYSVTLAADGTVRGREYEGPAHNHYTFDGTLEGGRAVLRISTSNNNASADLTGDGPRWSEAAGAVDPAEPTALGLMLERPWMFAVAGKENLRDHAGAAGNDERRFLFFSGMATPGGRAGMTSPSIHLRLRDGTTSAVTLAKAPGDDTAGESVALPAGVRGEDVVGVTGLPAASGLFVLDDDWSPRTLANA